MQNHQYWDTDSAGLGHPWYGEGALWAALARASSQAQAHLPFWWLCPEIWVLRVWLECAWAGRALLRLCRAGELFESSVQSPSHPSCTRHGSSHKDLPFMAVGRCL